MIDIRPVVFAVGAFVAILAPLMLVCAVVVDLDAENPDWMVFVASSVVVFGFGSMVALATWTDQFRFEVRQGFADGRGLRAMALVGATPFYFASLNADFADPVFEAVSAITTTGSTVLTDLDHMPPGILLWRALLQWIGGIGIIATALIVFPFLQVSGMQLFKMESSDVSEKYTARIADTTSRIALLYLGLTVATAVALIAAGMPAFDAVCHAMTAVSTGGFGTHDASIGYYGNREVEAILIVAMLAGSLTFVLMMRALAGDMSALLRDPQTRLFFAMIAIAVTCIAGWRIATSNVVPIDAVWSTLFSVVSIITTTGFVTDDYTSWGALSVVAFFFITFLGGCTGSTAGGLKAYRVYVLIVTTLAHFDSLRYPHRVVVLRYGSRSLDDKVVRSVMTFVMLYVASFILVATGLAATGLDIVTSLSASAQAIANVGPGLGDIIGPYGNFSTLGDSHKWILSAGMLLGRLEIVSVVMVFTPGFWSE